MPIKKIMQSPVIDRFFLLFSRVEPFGLMPKAPGTFGSAVGIILAPFIFMPFSWVGRAIILICLFIAGALASGRAEKILDQKDPGSVVIDEVLGQWITCLPFVTLSWQWLFVAFALFRLFDIIKPCPVRNAEKWFPGGISIMLDDVIAGIYAMLCMLAFTKIFYLFI